MSVKREKNVLSESEQEQTEAVSQAEPVPEPTVSQYYDQTSVLR